MKGIILAAGRGTRLYPMTQPVCKPLLPVYDKPMIYYPLSILLQAGIRDILIITPPDDGLEAFERLLGDGSRFGVRIQYAVQTVARGIADALIIGESFAAGDRVCLVLGDNIFFSPDFRTQLQQAMANETGATVFGVYVEDPRPFGVVEFDDAGNVVSLEEKPASPKTHYIVPGLYFYDSNAIEMAKALQPSARGELEITDLNIAYMQRGELRVVLLDRDCVWLDAGTADSMLMAALQIRHIQRQYRMYVGCLEALALEAGLISPESCRQSGLAMEKTPYGQYLLRMAEQAEQKEQEAAE